MFVEFAKETYNLEEGEFTVDPRYKVLAAIGRGAQGLICSAQDTAGSSSVADVAVKRMPNAVEEIISCKRMLREVRVMRHFKHENLLQLRDIMVPPSSNVLLWKDIYLVTDLMDTDLHHVISSQQELSDDHVQYFIFQLLAGVAHLHGASVVHRDLKPSNILVNRNCDLKICDFGLSRACLGCISTKDEDSQVQTPEPLTMYVTTRWYRAPELLCFNSAYGMAVDMWSVACILGEMLGRVALFPGRDYLEQLRLVVETLGPPPEEEMQTIESPSAVSFVRNVQAQSGKPLAELLPTASAEALALLQQILRFDPAKRLTAVEALKDPYLAAYYSDETEETTLPPGHGEWLHSVRNTDQLPKEQLQNLLFQEMLSFHPEAIHVPWGAASHALAGSSPMPTSPPAVTAHTQHFAPAPTQPQHPPQHPPHQQMPVAAHYMQMAAHGGGLAPHAMPMVHGGGMAQPSQMHLAAAGYAPHACAGMPYSHHAQHGSYQQPWAGAGAAVPMPCHQPPGAAQMGLYTCSHPQSPIGCCAPTGFPSSVYGAYAQGSPGHHTCYASSNGGYGADAAAQPASYAQPAP